MVAECDTDIALLMEEALIGEGYIVRRCRWPDVSVETVAQARPDMLIVALPCRDATATLRLLTRLRDCPGTRDIAVLVTSTDARVLRDLAAPLRHLCCVTQLEPFDLDDFLDRVARMTAPRASCRVGDTPRDRYASNC
jgi:CheY-like chemotaxis protein